MKLTMKNFLLLFVPVLVLSIFLVPVLLSVPEKNQQFVYGNRREYRQSCPACECSKMISSRILGGTEVPTVNKYPWMVAMNLDHGFCGGSLINSLYVLTAAHCVHNIDTSDGIVRLVEHNIQEIDESKGITRVIVRTIIHPSYDPQMADNDIALLKLNKVVPVGGGSELPHPICLAQNGDAFIGKNGVVLGWGRTAPGEPLSPVLREVFLPIVTDYECRYVYGSVFTPNKICAGIPGVSQGSLEHDSGGPLMAIENSKYYLVGIVLGGKSNVETSIYTRVSPYLDWIAKNTEDACPCPDYPKNEYTV